MQLTAIAFVGHVSTVIVTVADPPSWDAAACVCALKLVLAARYTQSRMAIVTAALTVVTTTVCICPSCYS